MCIIIFKNRSANLPTKKVLKTCFENNPDGAGYMVQTGKQVIINKGFMKFSDFYAEFKADKAITKNCNLVLHFRIATGGLVNSANCHPFPVSNRIDDLKNLNIKTDKAIAHNGVLSEFNDINKVLSDTQIFTKDILYFLMLENLKPNLIEALRNLTIGSRLCIFNQGNFLLLGNWITDKKTGLQFSNSGYKVDKRHNWKQGGWKNSSYFYSKSKCTKYTKDYIESEEITESEVFCPFCDRADNIEEYNGIYYCKNCETVWDDNDIYPIESESDKNNVNF